MQIIERNDCAFYQANNIVEFNSWLIYWKPRLRRPIRENTVRAYDCSTAWICCIFQRKVHRSLLRVCECSCEPTWAWSVTDPEYSKKIQILYRSASGCIYVFVLVYEQSWLSGEVQLTPNESLVTSGRKKFLPCAKEVPFYIRARTSLCNDGEDDDTRLTNAILALFHLY